MMKHRMTVLYHVYESLSSKYISILENLLRMPLLIFSNSWVKFIYEWKNTLHISKVKSNWRVNKRRITANHLSNRLPPSIHLKVNVKNKKIPRMQKMLLLKVEITSMMMMNGVQDYWMILWEWYELFEPLSCWEKSISSLEPKESINGIKGSLNEASESGLKHLWSRVKVTSEYRSFSSLQHLCSY